MGTIFNRIRDEANNFNRHSMRQPNLLIINSKLLTDLKRELEDKPFYQVSLNENIEESIYGMEIVETNKENYLKVCLTI